MIKIIIALIVGHGLLLGGCAQQQITGKQSTSSDTAQLNQPLLNNVSFTSLSTLPYTDNSIKLQYGTDALQYGQLYLPPAASLQTKVPLLVFIHGGCWLNAYDISHSRAFSQGVAAEGFAVWSLEYRRTGDLGGGWPGSYQDVQAGLNFAQTALAAYPVDLSRIVVVGHSAGGQLALLAAGESYQQATNSKAAVLGVIGLAAITDLAEYALGDNSCQRATSQFLGGSYPELSKVYQQASPHLQPPHPSTMLLHGAADTIVPLNQANAKGMPFKIVADAGHFDWIHPHTQAYKQFVIALQELLAQ